MADIVVPIFALVVGLSITVAGSDRTRAAARRYRRGMTWPRVTGTLRSVREEFKLAGDEGTTVYHVKYRFVVPETGQRRNGYSTRGDHRMSVGDDIEVMYDPDDPTSNDLPRGSTPWPVLGYGFVTLCGIVIAVGSAIGILQFAGVLPNPDGGL